MKTFLARFMKNEFRRNGHRIWPDRRVDFDRHYRRRSFDRQQTIHHLRHDSERIACVTRHATHYAPIHPSQNAALSGPRFICARRLSMDAPPVNGRSINLL